MPRYRALVMGRDTAYQGRDVITNTLYFNDTGETTDADNLADDLADLYVAQSTFMRDCNEIEVRFYDMAEPKPREIQGQAKKSYTKGSSGPREVALCLSFFAQRNLKRNRGRIYLGPIVASTSRPTPAQMTAAINLAHGFADLGGTDVDWCVFSPTTLAGGTDYASAFKKITNIWVDDEWDTQRSRGLRPTTRYDETTGA